MLLCNEQNLLHCAMHRISTCNNYLQCTTLQQNKNASILTQKVFLKCAGIDKYNTPHFNIFCVHKKSNSFDFFMFWCLPWMWIHCIKKCGSNSPWLHFFLQGLEKVLLGSCNPNWHTLGAAKILLNTQNTFLFSLVQHALINFAFVLFHKSLPNPLCCKKLMFF